MNAVELEPMAEHILYKLGPFDVPGLASRYVRVFVPRAPAAPPGPRPVLYMFDGQNLFHDEPSYSGGWYLHRTLDRIAKKQATPVLVGVDHGGVARIDELGPWHTERGGGKTDALLDWMCGTLCPRIEAEFGVASAPDGVGIGGSSMGGLAAMYAHHRKPEKFGSVLSMSPSFWFAQGKIIEVVAATSKPWTSRVYVDAGGKEGPALHKLCTKVFEALRAKGYEKGALMYRRDKQGTHNERHWRRRAGGAIRFLFPHPSKRSGRVAA
jgi:enterochelin esterase-like enzyme